MKQGRRKCHVGKMSYRQRIETAAEASGEIEKAAVLQNRARGFVPLDG